MAKRWLKTDLAYLKRYAKTRSLADLAERFRSDPATMRAKLTELRLASRDGQGWVEPVVDPLLEVYEQGLKSLYRQRWAEASKLFARVAAEADQPELAQRARQHLEACRLKKEEEKAGEPTADDPFLLAVYHKNRGEYEAALQICSRGGRQSKDERFAYLVASIHALRGEMQEAARFLELAVGLNPKNRVHAHHDPDFAELRRRPEHAGLFGRG